MGVTDGMCNGVRFFTTRRQSAVFISVSSLLFPQSAPAIVLSPSTSFSLRDPIAQSTKNQTSYFLAEEPSSATGGKSKGYKSSWLIDLRSSRSISSPPSERPSIHSSGSPSTQHGKFSSDAASSDNIFASVLEVTVVEASPAAAALPPLHIGERVVFFQDGGPEYGSVKWIGSLPGYPHPMAGVEFVSPHPLALNSPPLLITVISG